MYGSHCIKTWSSTQGVVALSSAEAEYYAMVDGVIKGKGIVSVGTELGIFNKRAVIHLYTDSSAAKAHVCRKGTGRMRHMES